MKTEWALFGFIIVLFVWYLPPLLPHICTHQRVSAVRAALVRYDSCKHLFLPLCICHSPPRPTWMKIQNEESVILFLVVWTLTEITRYSYYTFSLLHHLPYFIKWARWRCYHPWPGWAWIVFIVSDIASRACCRWSGDFTSGMLPTSGRDRSSAAVRVWSIARLTQSILACVCLLISTSSGILWVN